MDQDTVVSDRTKNGEQLIEALAAAGIDVQVAFWAKPSDEGKWYLYLASPLVEKEGPKAAYLSVYGVMKKLSDIWIEPLDVRLVGLRDSLTEAVLAATRPKAPDSPFAVQNPRPYPGMTQFGGSTLGGLSVDGAYIYPPPHPGVSA